MNALTSTCPDCDKPLTRLRYFPGQMLTADCMATEQAYFMDRMRRRNRLLHGFGVVCGLDVKLKEPGDQGSVGAAPVPAGAEVWVCPGFAVTPEGDEVLLDEPVCVDLATGKQDPDPCCDPFPCPPVGQGASTGVRDTFTVWLAIRYAECMTRPVKVPPTGCGCDDMACDYSRIRESYEIRCLPALPQSHVTAEERQEAWRETIRDWAVPDSTSDQRRGPMPVPDCPPCPEDPWVVLARIVLRRVPGQGLRIIALSFVDRRVLLSTQNLQTIFIPD